MSETYINDKDKNIIKENEDNQNNNEDKQMALIISIT